jgi:hypothetical protein
MFNYECDVAYDCSIEFIAKMCEDTNATMRVIEANGPAGGNPRLSFEFTNADDMNAFSSKLRDIHRQRLLNVLDLL